MGFQGEVCECSSFPCSAFLLGKFHLPLRGQSRTPELPSSSPSQRQSLLDLSFIHLAKRWNNSNQRKIKMKLNLCANPSFLWVWDSTCPGAKCSVSAAWEWNKCHKWVKIFCGQLVQRFISFKVEAPYVIPLGRVKSERPQTALNYSAVVKIYQMLLCAT